MLEAQGLEAAKQIGLVGGCGRGGDTAVGATPDGAIAVDVELAVIRLSEHIVLAGAAVAQGVFERHVVVQVVLDGERADVGASLAEVTAFQTVEVVAVAAIVGFVMHVGRGGRRTVAVGNPRIRQVITFHMVVAEVDAGRCAQAKGQRRCHAPTVVVHRIAASHVLFMAHQVQAEGRAVVQELAVHVEHVAAGLVGAVGKAAVGEVPRLWGLAHQVEAATGRATAAERGVGAFADFDGLDVEDLAALAAGIAYAIEVGVALSVKTTDKRTVALRVATFTGAEGDTRYGAQGILQRGGGGVLEYLLRHHSDRARRVHQRRGVLLRRGFLHLVGGVVLLLAGDVGGAEGDRVALAFWLGIFSRLRQVGGGAGTQGNADGRSQHAW